MIKLCECGCGKPAPIAKMTNRQYGWIQGQPKRFIQGHNRASLPESEVWKRHGMTGTPAWRSWLAARQRCQNPHNPKFADYGARGIKFLFTSFEEFFAELGPRPQGMTLDRINNDGNYEPGNVRWATDEQQRSNKRPRRNPKAEKIAA